MCISCLLYHKLLIGYNTRYAGSISNSENLAPYKDMIDGVNGIYNNSKNCGKGPTGTPCGPGLECCQQNENGVINGLGVCVKPGCCNQKLGLPKAECRTQAENYQAPSEPNGNEPIGNEPIRSREGYTARKDWKNSMLLLYVLIALLVVIVLLECKSI